MDGGAILGIIFIAVIGLISSAAKNAKKREEARRNEQGQGQPPPRSVPLSDIQKAFMMAQNPAPPQAPPQPVHARPQASPQPVYTPPQAAAYTPIQAAAYTPIQARTTDTMQARVTTAVPPHPMYAARQDAAQPRAAYTPVQPTSKLPSDFYSGSMEALSGEGRVDGEISETPLEAVRVVNLENVMDTDIGTISDLDTPIQPVRNAAGKPVSKRLPVKLFENNNEFVKAVIYSEILSRRSPGRVRRA